MVYAAICGYAWLSQRQAMYFPQLTHVDPDGTDFTFESGDLVLRGWVVNPGETDAVLYFGGNAERVEMNRQPFTRWFPRRSVYLVPYRGYGPNDGEPTEKHLYADAVALYETVRTRHPQGSIAVVGRSLGSGVASHLASQREVDKLVLVTPFDSLAAVGQAHYPWLPVRWLMTDRYDSARHLRDYDGEILIIRAARDRVIPPANTDRLIANLRQRPMVVEFAQAGHNDLPEDRYRRAVVAFLNGGDPQ